MKLKKAFNSKASHRLFEMFRDARNENKRPYWIGGCVLNDLLSHWNAPEYRSKCEQAKKKIGHLKRVGVCTQVVLLAGRITPFAWYVHYNYNTYLFNLPLNVYFIMFVNS